MVTESLRFIPGICHFHITRMRRVASMPRRSLLDVVAIERAGKTFGPSSRVPPLSPKSRQLESKREAFPPETGQYNMLYSADGNSFVADHWIAALFLDISGFT